MRLQKISGSFCLCAPDPLPEDETQIGLTGELPGDRETSWCLFELLSKRTLYYSGALLHLRATLRGASPLHLVSQFGFLLSEICHGS